MTTQAFRRIGRVTLASSIGACLILIAPLMGSVESRPWIPAISLAVAVLLIAPRIPVSTSRVVRGALTGLHSALLICVGGFVLVLLERADGVQSDLSQLAKRFVERLGSFPPGQTILGELKDVEPNRIPQAGPS